MAVLRLTSADVATGHSMGDLESQKFVLGEFLGKNIVTKHFGKQFFFAALYSWNTETKPPD